jgi:CheY-like chemotaxis protein/HPt (histidine-containing phosphotransfer) domain-containing protein
LLAPEKSAELIAPVGTACALIVEDQHYNQVVLASLLAQLDYRTECANDAEQAFAAFAKKIFTVIFLDVELAGMKGPEVARRLRALPRGSEPIIIGASANDSREAEARCLSGGMDAFLVKPLTADAIRGAIAEVALRRALAKQSGDLEAIDYTSLELYARNIPGGMRGATQTYVALLQSELETLRFAIEGDLAEAIWQAAHKVRSHGSLIGASKLCAFAGELEREARTGRLERRLILWQKISEEAESLQGQLTAKALV